MTDEHLDTQEGPTPVERFKALLKRSFSIKALVWVLLCTILGTGIGYYTAKKRPYQWNVRALILAHVGREFGSARSEIIVAGGNSHVVARPSKENLRTEVELMQSPDLLRRTYESLRQDQDLIELREQQRKEREKRQKESGGSGGGGGGFSVMNLLSKSVNDLLRRLDLTYVADPTDEGFENWAGQLGVNVVARSNMIGVQCVTPNPELGKRFLERWIEEYTQLHIEAYSQQDTQPLFRDEVKRLQGVLKEAEDKLTELRKETSVFDIGMMQKSMLDQRMKAIAELYRLDAEIASQNERLRAVTGHLESDEVPVESVTARTENRNPLRDQYDRIVLQLEQQIAEAQTRYKDGDPNIERELMKRDAILELLRDHPGLEPVRHSSQSTGRDPVHSQLRQSKYTTLVDIASLEAQRRQIEKNIVELTEDLVHLENQRWKHEELLDEISSARKDLAQVREGERIGRMNATLDNARVTNVKVVSPPTIPPSPIKMMGFPHRVAITGIGGMLGFGISLGLYLFLIALREAGFLPFRSKKEKVVEVAATDEPEVWMISDEDDRDADGR